MVHKSIVGLLLASLFCLMSAIVVGQEIARDILSSSGGSFTQDVGLEWTLGEIAITEFTTSDIRITQGFHQPSFLSTKTTDLPADLGEVSVYPNPFSEILRLDLSYERATTTRVRLFTVQGQLLWDKSIIGNSFREDVDLEFLNSGSYFLHLLIDENRFGKIFKVHKI